MHKKTSIARNLWKKKKKESERFELVASSLSWISIISVKESKMAIARNLLEIGEMGNFFYFSPALVHINSWQVSLKLPMLSFILMWTQKDQDYCQITWFHKHTNLSIIGFWPAVHKESFCHFTRRKSF